MTGSSRKARALLIAAACCVFQATQALAFVYAAPSIQGQVLDAETEKPVQDVVVVAHWQLKGGIEGGTPINEIKILEAVTDRTGRYYLPGWGPRFAFLGDPQGPELFVFKQGYRFQRLRNDWNRRQSPRSDWNNRAIHLEPFRGPLAKYAEDLESLNSGLWTVGFDVGRHQGDYCGWKSFPRMLRALERLEDAFREANVHRWTLFGQLNANEAFLRKYGCGSITDFLREAGQ